MKRVFFYVFIFVIATAFISVAQTIPNAGFEKWKNGEPEKWKTSNMIADNSIIRTKDAHSGTSAAQGNVVKLAGINYPPQLFIGGVFGPGFAINSRPLEFNGFYKTTLAKGEELEITIGLNKKGKTIGSGQFKTGTSESSYKKFTTAVNYINKIVVPDEAFIIITIKGPKSGINLKSNFKIDDLSF